MLGSLILYIKGMRILMFQLSGFYYRALLGFSDVGLRFLQNPCNTLLAKSLDPLSTEQEPTSRNFLSLASSGISASGCPAQNSAGRPWSCGGIAKTTGSSRVGPLEGTPRAQSAPCQPPHTRSSRLPLSAALSRSQRPQRPLGKA